MEHRGVGSHPLCLSEGVGLGGEEGSPGVSRTWGFGRSNVELVEALAIYSGSQRDSIGVFLLHSPCDIKSDSL